MSADRIAVLDGRRGRRDRLTRRADRGRRRLRAAVPQLGRAGRRVGRRGEHTFCPTRSVGCAKFSCGAGTRTPITASRGPRLTIRRPRKERREDSHFRDERLARKCGSCSRRGRASTRSPGCSGSTPPTVCVPQAQARLSACRTSAPTRYDWAAIQRYYDDGHIGRDCIEQFGFSRGAWPMPCKRGAIVPRPRRCRSTSC